MAETPTDLLACISPTLQSRRPREVLLAVGRPILLGTAARVASVPVTLSA